MDTRSSSTSQPPHYPGLHIQEVSSDSTTTIAEHDLSDLTHHQQPYHTHDARRTLPGAPDSAYSSGSATSTDRTKLQSFQTWDPTWRSGGVSADGRAYTEAPVYEHVQQHYPDTVQDQREFADNGVRQPYLGGWVDDSSDGYKGLVEGEYRYGVGYEAASGATSASVGRAPIDAERKAQRLKALQREFGAGHASLSADDSNTTQGSKGSSKKKRKHPSYEPAPTYKELREREKAQRREAEAECGIDRNGELLIVHGRKWRTGMRWFQGVGAAIALFAGLGGALFIKIPEGEDPPPPSGRISTWALYLLSFLTLAYTLYSTCIQPCLHRRKNGAAATHPATMAGAGGLVMPIYTTPASTAYSASGKKGRKQKYRKMKGGKEQQMMMQQQPMTVNLVVDPVALARLSGSAPPSRYDDSRSTRAEKGVGASHDVASSQRSDEADSEAENSDDCDFAIPDSSRRSNDKAGLTGLLQSSLMDPGAFAALEKRWKLARKRMRWRAFWDGLLGLLWAADAVWAIGWTGRCPPGSASGWCDLYNTALACGVLLSVSFFTSCTFCILDLRRNRSAPRPSVLSRV